MHRSFASGRQLRQRPAGVHRQGSHHRRQPGRTPCCAL
jgi:hypothetical protein